MSEVVDSIVSAFNRRDLDGFCACYARDVVIEDGGGSMLVRGVDELRSRYGTMFASSPELHCEVLNRIAVGPYVIDDERVSGRGPEVERLAVVYLLRDGVVAHERILR